MRRKDKRADDIKNIILYLITEMTVQLKYSFFIPTRRNEEVIYYYN